VGGIEVSGRNLHGPDTCVECAYLNELLSTPVQKNSNGALLSFGLHYVRQELRTILGVKSRTTDSRRLESSYPLPTLPVFGGIVAERLFDEIFRHERGAKSQTALFKILRAFPQLLDHHIPHLETGFTCIHPHAVLTFGRSCPFPLAPFSRLVSDRFLLIATPVSVLPVWRQDACAVTGAGNSRVVCSVFVVPRPTSVLATRAILEVSHLGWTSLPSQLFEPQQFRRTTKLNYMKTIMVD
jgi:hypothetical protein